MVCRVEVFRGDRVQADHHRRLVVEVEHQDLVPDAVVAGQSLDVLGAAAEDVAEPLGAEHGREAFATFLVVCREIGAMPQMLDQRLLHLLQANAHGVVRLREAVVDVTRDVGGIGSPFGDHLHETAHPLQLRVHVLGREPIVGVVGGGPRGHQVIGLVRHQITIVLHHTAHEAGAGHLPRVEREAVVRTGLGLAILGWHVALEDRREVAEARCPDHKNRLILGVLEQLPEQVFHVGEVGLRALVRRTKLDVLVGLATTESVTQRDGDVIQAELVQGAARNLRPVENRVAVGNDQERLGDAQALQTSQQDEASFFVGIVADLAEVDDAGYLLLFQLGHAVLQVILRQFY